MLHFDCRRAAVLLLSPFPIAAEKQCKDCVGDATHCIRNIACRPAAFRIRESNPYGSSQDLYCGQVGVARTARHLRIRIVSILHMKFRIFISLS